MTHDGNWTQVWLEELRSAIRVEVGPYAADRLTLRKQFEWAGYELSTSVLADRLSTEHVERNRSVTVTTVRFTTWWDHFKAAYRGRWWMRWRYWPVRQTVAEQTVTVTVAINLERFWTFPRAPVALPDLGAPVRAIVPNPLPLRYSDSATTQWTHRW
ncbi:hypothetical protein E1091_15315 [Micromonospora fluostatini]|uniref:Uncharacterized protein n=1 Tax=Micromonospora fluostatini TaxID=1629071 RepID=A0ABY2DE29_9ACTN|nr:hypothetical protein E1091_15315 [Micromonospora fluostatini]